MSDELYELPDGWRWATISEVCETTSGGTPHRQKNEYFGGSIPWVKSGELEDSVICKTEETITESGLANSSAKIFPKGTVLIALYGATVGRTGLLNIDAATNQAVCAVFPQVTFLQTHYLWLYFQSQRQSLVGVSTGGAQPNISQRIIRDWPIPLPPLPQQQRIVETIEKLLAESRTARAALDKVPFILKRFRQSVLAKAFRGELTERDPNDEPATVLLERIREERRKKWEGEKGGKGKKYIEPEPPDTIELLELPQGWCWATIEQLASFEPYSIQSGPFGSDLLHSEFQDTGFLAIGIDNVLNGQFSLGRQHRISPKKFEQLKRFRARPLDVLITVMATVGRCCVIPSNIEPAIITKHVYRIAVEKRLTNPYYLMYSLLGEDLQLQISGEIRGQTRPGINGVILRELTLPLPPLFEQHRIVAKIESLFAQANAIERAVEIARRRAEKVDQAVLARAFRGEL